MRRAHKFHVPTLLKSGSLNLLESSGSVQACNGIDLPFDFGDINAVVAPITGGK